MNKQFVPFTSDTVYKYTGEGLIPTGVEVKFADGVAGLSLGSVRPMKYHEQTLVRYGRRDDPSEVWYPSDILLVDSAYIEK